MQQLFLAIASFGVSSLWFEDISIHTNQVKDHIVALPKYYYFSSARNYAGLDNDLEIIMLDLFWE